MEFNLFTYVFQSDLLAISKNTIVDTAIVWLAIILFVSIITWLIKKSAEGSKSDIDDVSISIMSKSAILLVFLSGITSVLYSLNLASTYQGYIKIGFNLLGTILGLNFIWRLVYKELIGNILTIRATKTESSIDDILIPVLKTVFPLLFFIIGGMFLLQSVGVNISGWTVILGGASFIFAFALQGILGDIFAGIALLADTPFAKGDIIELEGRLVEVKKIGIRVTELYNFDDHNTIFVPNSSLSQVNIINLNYPTPDTRKRFDVGVGYDSNPRIVKKLLCDCTNANPYILGNPEEKIELMKSRLENVKKKMTEVEELYKEEYETLIWGIKKWEKEVPFLEALNRLYKKLISFASSTDQATLAQQKNIISEYDDIIKNEYGELLKTLNEWIKIVLEDPNLFSIDATLIPENWKHKMTYLEKRIMDFKKYIKVADSADIKRVDLESTQLANWLFERFKDPYESWKDPDAEFSSMGDSALIFSLEFFIDDIKSERFERIGRVMSEMNRNVFETLKENNIEIPFPQRDVWFRSNPVVPKN